MQPYHPLASGIIFEAAPSIWKISTADPDRRQIAEEYLKAHGYRFGHHDRGDGTVIEGWRFYR